MAEHPQYRLPLSSAASTTDGAQLIVLAQIHMISVMISIDFIPFLICCEVFSRLCHDVIVHMYYL